MAYACVDLNRLHRALMLTAILIPAVGCPEAWAANALERALERLQPCQGLKVDIGLTTLGVDKLERLSVEEIAIVVKGNAADASVLGSLACKTSDAALKKGDASARFRVKAHMDLSTCAVSEQQTEILSTGGTFGGLVDLFRNRIKRTIEDGLAGELGKLCR
ncbi:hypothetical protein MBLL_00453 (plasmid) [Methylobacterium bullatum]|uniref:Uncharacterized protein n=2 Tax=Methylobacterium bullatum TaxID=570505 RepID=A0A679JPJ9_9HYPH|nr:hypothetical protein MBLL_00453 [Methylobacterium bullatum]